MERQENFDLWTIHIDGAARGNPGPASAGVLIEHAHHPAIKEGIYLGEKTNNQAEYIALAYALFLIQKNVQHTHPKLPIKLLIYSDSQLLVRQIQGLYKVKNENLARIKKNIDAALAHVNHSIIHVVRENNKEADKLANMAIDLKLKIPTDFQKILANCGIENQT